MTSSDSRIVKIPTDQQIREAFEAYSMAVGKVAYAWNYLHERLGQLFAVVCATDREIALAIWYSTDSDRAQRLLMISVRLIESSVSIPAGCDQKTHKLVSCGTWNTLMKLLMAGNTTCRKAIVSTALSGLMLNPDCQFRQSGLLS
jgi:hypothetical protein